MKTSTKLRGCQTWNCRF